MCGLNNVLAFKKENKSQKEGGPTSFDITVVFSRKCKGYE